MSENKNTTKQKKWTIEDLKDGLKHYHELNKRYPTAREVDESEFLPSARSIQRRFGGLVELRKTIGLNGSIDFRKGEYSSDRAKKINERASVVEKQVHEYLINLFGVEFVHREFFFTDDKRTRTDFFIYCKNGNFSVDVFFAQDRHSFIGCLNSKMRTYSSIEMLQYPVIFLHMNSKISSEEIESILKNKKNKLLRYQKVMTFNEFETFCTSKKRKQK